LDFLRLLFFIFLYFKKKLTWRNYKGKYGNEKDFEIENKKKKIRPNGPSSEYHLIKDQRAVGCELGVKLVETVEDKLYMIKKEK